MKSISIAALAAVFAVMSGFAVAGVNPGAGSSSQMNQSGAKIAPPKKQEQEEQHAADKDDAAKDKKD